MSENITDSRNFAQQCCALELVYVHLIPDQPEVVGEDAQQCCALEFVHLIPDHSQSHTS